MAEQLLVWEAQGKGVRGDYGVIRVYAPDEAEARNQLRLANMTEVMSLRCLGRPRKAPDGEGLLRIFLVILGVLSFALLLSYPVVGGIMALIVAGAWRARKNRVALAGLSPQEAEVERARQKEAERREEAATKPSWLRIFVLLAWVLLILVVVCAAVWLCGGSLPWSRGAW